MINWASPTMVGDIKTSTPRALAELWGLLRDNEVETQAALEAILDMDSILALNLEDAFHTVEESEFSAEIEALIAERAEAKKAKDFARADEIRNLLKERGIILSDSPTGTQWKKV